MGEQVLPVASQNEPSNIDHPPLSRSRQIITRLFFLTVGLAWLAPIITLLVLNAKRFVIGSGFSCHRGTCLLNPVASNYTQVINQLNSINHDVLGAFQLLAQALQLWFAFIAGSLVYNLSVLLARRGDGLPLRYLFTYTAFADPLNLNMSFWTAARRGESGDNTGQTHTPKTSTATLYLFAAFIGALCVVANLMGPSTAVLLLPTLGTVKIHTSPPAMFIKLGAASPPTKAVGQYLQLFDPSCYSCYYPSSDNLDPIIVDAGSDRTPTLIIFRWGVQSPFNPTSNVTTGADQLTITFWTPLQQTLAQIGADYRQYSISFLENLSVTNQYRIFTNETWSQSTYDTYRSSTDVVINRQGPALLSSSACFLGNVSVITLSVDKSIRCYTAYPPKPAVPGPMYPLSDPAHGISTKCIRIGSGWTGAGATNDQAQFYLTTNTTVSTNLAGTDFSTAGVHVYSVASAIFLNSTTSHCSKLDSLCNWDQLFSEPPPSQYRNISLNQQITEYDYPNDAADDPYNYPGPFTINWCYAAAYPSFGLYSIDTSPGNLQGFPKVQVVPDSISPATDPIYVHSDWTLATWSVNESGIVYANSTYGAVESLLALLRGGDYGTIDFVQAIITATIFSLISYDEHEGVTTSSNQTLYPLLQSFATAQALSYGLSSRTSQLGFAVAVLGCIVVCFYFVVMLCARPPRVQGPDVLDLFTKALQQHPPERLAGLSGEELERVRFMVEDEKEGSELKFERGLGEKKATATLRG
jgi:hypothetical protein